MSLVVENPLWGNKEAWGLGGITSEQGGSNTSETCFLAPSISLTKHRFEDKIVKNLKTVTSEH